MGNYFQSAMNAISHLSAQHHPAESWTTLSISCIIIYCDLGNIGTSHPPSTSWVHSAQVPRCRYSVEIVVRGVEYTETVWDSSAVRQCHCVWRDRGPRATGAQYGQAEIQGDTWSTLLQYSSAIFTAILTE